jgi:hypothetical protein
VDSLAPPPASLADLEPDLDYADWRNVLMNFISSTDPTYFSWPEPADAHRIAVLRGSVLSTLAVGETVRGLARAVLADALHAAGTAGLEEWAEKFADEFVDEVIGPEVARGYEVPLRSVAAWVIGRSLADMPN